MKSSLAVVPGTFDPITYGHQDIVLRTRDLFGRVIVAVAANPAKAPLFGLKARVALAQAALADEPNVTVEAVPGLLADYCRQVGASAIVKGLRGGPDLDHEQPMATVNHQLAGIETVFLPAGASWGSVSSSIVKDVARHGGDVSRYVAPAVAQALAAAFAV
ncbi:MAG: pantetheine-phosphate adenylyltransferase [Bifidobacteriaceae bacterium]|jgi:pantetheine-phosphate adenylyltransferase|nr:pantetheine-phosphate adenylyltransferase [Bifidobacteriaceae bacterium]